MADGTVSLSFLFVLIVSSFALPLVFMAWIRNTERYGREPWHKVLKAFFWGAVFSVIVAIVFSLILLAILGQIQPLTDFLARRFADPPTIIGAVIVAPFVEEAAKALGVRAGRMSIRNPGDGLVYGASAGLGFSATENLFFGLVALTAPGGGPTASLAIVAIRSFSSSFLHASATAVTGYGLAKSWLTLRTWAFLPFYVVAVWMHATFNLLASVGVTYAQQYGEFGELIALAAAVIFAVVAITIVRITLAAHRPSTMR